MTTRDKGITLPQAGAFIDSSGGSYKVTGTANDYTVKSAWSYGPGVITPINALPSITGPIDFLIIGQNAAAGFGSVGGNIWAIPGVGSSGNSSGNLNVTDTGGSGGAWNKAHIVLGALHLWLDANNTLRVKGSIPTGDQDGNSVAFNLSASGVYDAPSLADGVGTTTTIACAGAVLGDFAIASLGVDLAGIVLTAYVSAANVVSIRLQNESGGTVDLASTTLRVKVIKQ